MKKASSKFHDFLLLMWSIILGCCHFVAFEKSLRVCGADFEVTQHLRLIVFKCPILQIGVLNIYEYCLIGGTVLLLFFKVFNIDRSQFL